MNAQRPVHRAAARGFTLLEVVIAIAILAVSLFVLIDAQSTAVFMTVDAEKTLKGTYLAQEKMAEALMRIEHDGFREGSIEEDGDFSDFGEEGARGADQDFGEEFADYKWAYAIREVDLQLGDLTGAVDELEQSGLGGTSAGASNTEQSSADQRDLSDMGFQPDMLSDMLKPYIREVRVLVWWGPEEPDLDKGCEDCVELVTHLVNPTGTIIPGASSEESG